VSVQIQDQRYYITPEVAEKAKVHKSTLFRWIAEGRIARPGLKDRKGWYLWTQEELDKVLEKAQVTIKVS
jgi:predicted site-specific integrase-resolvase